MDQDKRLTNQQHDHKDDRADMLQAVCGMCGRRLNEADDLFAELCRACEERMLKARQQRTRQPPRRAERLP